MGFSRKNNPLNQSIEGIKLGHKMGTLSSVRFARDGPLKNDGVGQLG